MALPKSIGIRLFDDSFVPVLTEGEVKNKRVILTTVRDNQEKAIIELFEGTSDTCSENEYLGKLTIDINRNTDKGEPGLEVNLRLDDEGVLYAKAWDQESKEESEIVIEHSSARQIIPETLTDDEINDMGDTKYQEIPSYYEDSNQDYVTHKMNNEPQTTFNEEKPMNKKLIIIILAIILLLILGILLFFMLKNTPKKQPKPVVKETVIETTNVIEEPEIIPPPEEIKPVEIKQEAEKIIGTNKLEGKKHFVKRGDNLWNICKRYYKDPWYYPNLAEQNQINNPRLILAGTYIIIPPKSSVKRWDFSR